MKLAVWDTPPASFLISGFTSGAVEAPFERIVRARPEECAALLLGGQVDVALLPTSMVLQAADGFEVVPGVALSTWKYPYARLVLKEGLRGPVETVAYDKRSVQEQLVARIILQEHYGKEPTFHAYDRPSLQALLGAEEDAALLVGGDVPTRQVPGLTMDLGQEWFELAGYPMVWGLLAAQKDTLTPPIVQALLDGVAAAEEQRPTWVQAQESPATLHEFYRNDLRIRFDDLATASLTELKRYLFYYQILGDVPSLTFAEQPEDGGKQEDGRQPMV